MKHNQNGSLHIVLALSIILIALIGFAGWQVLKTEEKPTVSDTQTATPNSIDTTLKTNKTAEQEKPKTPDSASTIDTPQKIATSDGKQYFYYGAPTGQNNAAPKKILITMHGTEGSAERDYEVWKPYIKDTDYALASLNWWDGSGDATTDYSTPEVINSYIHEFLSNQGYRASDTIVYEGFSRGSANSYPVVAHDRASTQPLIDVAVSSSGGATNEYFTMTTKSIPAAKLSKIFTGVKWIFACGEKDENPNRDGCTAMNNSKSFVEARGGISLGVLSDANAGHGALTTSSLNLPKKMFELIK